MKKEIKEKWIDALRSGEYTQTQGSLRNENGYCCLGVLCDLYTKEHNLKWDSHYSSFAERTVYQLEDYQNLPPSSVLTWAGLNQQDPYVKYVDKDSNEIKETLSKLNDTGKTFLDISEYIDTSL